MERMRVEKDAKPKFAGTKALVLGLGESGQAAALKLSSLGADVLATDPARTTALHEAATALSAGGVRVVLGRQDVSQLNGADLVIASPGVPDHAPVLAAAHGRGVPVWSEIELAFRLTDRPIVAITGTNGKTSTTTLVGEMFRAAGRKAIVAGNIGLPLVRAVEDAADADVIVAEVSSFQLQNIVEFRAAVGVILNIAQDHLDWHPNFQHYVDAKARLFRNQTPGDYAVINKDDELAWALSERVHSKIVPFSKEPLETGVCVENGAIRVKLESRSEAVCDIDRLRLPGAHNLENALGAVASAWLMDVDTDALRRALAEFKGLPHRLEFVASINGVDYYNDSKATNPHATIKAVETFEENLVLLLGGRNKGNDFSTMGRHFGEKVRAVVVFGEAAAEIAGDLATCVPIVWAVDVAEAVGLAKEIAKPGWTVLFSPACASFDAFSGYADRGKAFARTVCDLERTAS